MLIRSTVLGLTLASAAALATAATPAVDSLTAGFAFDAYAGTMPVGDGRVNVDSTLFYIDENTVGGLTSYYIFFDPSEQQTVDATLTFAGPISSIITTKAGLDGSNAMYGIPSVTYATSTYIGLEPIQDSATFTGNTLTLHLSSSQPGDSLRVLVDTSPVPEPETYGLFALGLAALAFVQYRRGRQG